MTHPLFSFPRTPKFLLWDIPKQGNTLCIYPLSQDLNILPVQTDRTVLAQMRLLEAEQIKCISIQGEFGVRSYILVRESDNHLVQEWIYTEIAECVRSLKDLEGVCIALGLDTERLIETIGLSLYLFPKISQAVAETTKSVYIHAVGIDSNNFSRILKRIEATWLVRDLVNLPSNMKNPEQLVALVQKLPWKNTVLRVLEKTELERLGFWLLLAVGAWSNIPSRVLIFERLGKNRVHRALVGKGVTFDAGGIQIKSDDGMKDMKMDMAGSAAVIGGFWYADTFSLWEEGYIWIIGLVENMLGGSAFKPLDILTSHSWKTVEVRHTDAEWRLVLGDLVSYAYSQYSPRSVITFATLTGACMAALGYNYAGLMSQDEELVKSIESIASRDQEQVWRLPLDKNMIEATKSTNADLQNHTKSYMAGASMGAAFISNFLPKTTEFAHLDIAGPAYRSKAWGVFPANATGFGTSIAIGLLGLE